MIRVVARLSFLLVFIPSVAVSQDDTATNGAEFGDWQLQCTARAVNETACGLVQTIMTSEDNRFIAEIGVNRIEVEDAPRVFVAMRTPSAMLLTDQPAYRVGEDGDVRALQWRSCAGDFCLAGRVLEDAEVEELRAGASIRFGYQAFNAEEPTNFQGSLVGLSDGLSALGF